MASEKYASDPPSSWNQKLKPSPTSDMKESDGETANASTAKATATSKTYTKTSDTNAAASENTAAIPPNNSTVLAAGLSNMEAVDTEELYGDLTNSPLVKTSQEKRNLLQNKRLLVNHQTCQQVTNGAVFTENHDEMVVVRDIDIHSLCEHHMVQKTHTCKTLTLLCCFLFRDNRIHIAIIAIEDLLPNLITTA
jgi:hypothetical protein